MLIHYKDYLNMLYISTTSTTTSNVKNYAHSSYYLLWHIESAVRKYIINTI